MVLIDEDWRARVYKPREDETGLSPEEWKMIRDDVIRRDNKTCFRCDKKYKKSDLSVHHITPRALGGSNAKTNLITLCHSCHDFVEIKGLRSKADIIGSYERLDVTFHTKEEIEELEPKEESFDRPSWHKFVYGGMKKS